MNKVIRTVRWLSMRAWARMAGGRPKGRIDTMVAYALIGVAVVAEVFGDSMMKLSNGFQKVAACGHGPWLRYCVLSDCSYA